MSRLVVAMEELVEVGDIWSEEAGGNSDGSGEDIWRLTKLTVSKPYLISGVGSFLGSCKLEWLSRGSLHSADKSPLSPL